MTQFSNTWKLWVIKDGMYPLFPLCSFNSFIIATNAMNRITDQSIDRAFITVSDSGKIVAYRILK